MTLDRRKILGIAAAVVAAPSFARAQAYPARPVKVIVSKYFVSL